VTLGPNGLFYQGSRGGMYKRRCERLSRPLGGTEVGLAPGGGLVGRPPDGMPAPQKNWQRFRVGPFPHGVGQTTPREALPTLGGREHGGWLRSGGRLGWSSPRWNAGLPKNIMGSASAWARFLMGLGKQRRKRRPRRLGVVSLAVGCAPGWGIVFIPLMERRADTMGSASAWARFFMGFGRQRREGLGMAIMFLALAPFAPAAGPLRTKSSSPSSQLRTFSMDAVKGNPLLGGALGFPPVSAGSSCRAFVQSLARAFIQAAVVLVASLAVGPAPLSEAHFADAHGLVGACVVMLVVVSQLRRRCHGAVAPTIAAVTVTLVAVA
jgi:hypothetical protein